MEQENRINDSWTPLDRQTTCHFRLFHSALVAQQEEQQTFNLLVAGSIPAGGSKYTAKEKDTAAWDIHTTFRTSKSQTIF